MPAVVHVTAEYTDDAGSSFTAAIEDLRVDFDDLFCEPPFPLQWPTEGGACYAYRLSLYEQLWDLFNTQASNNDEVRM